MVNVSGHLLSTAEVESALIEHEAVTEAASVSHPHEIKGDCIYCFVTLKEVWNCFKTRRNVRSLTFRVLQPACIYLHQN